MKSFIWVKLIGETAVREELPEQPNGGAISVNNMAGGQTKTGFSQNLSSGAPAAIRQRGGSVCVCVCVRERERLV